MARPIVISILANASQARAELNSTGGVFSKFGKLAGAGLALAGVAVGSFAVKAVKGASDAQQSIGATETVFGKFSDTVIKTSDKAARAYGLSANSYRENANLIGSLFKNQGVDTDKLAGKTEEMIAKASDLSATFGGPTTLAVEALGAAFKGEFNQLEKYGISIKQSTINTEAMRVANVKTTSEFNKLSAAQQAAAKQQATTNLINKQSKDSTGAFARETKTLAHQQQVLGAQFDNIKVKVGTALIPILTRFLTFLNNKGPAAFNAIKAAIAPVIAFFQNLGGASDSTGGKFQQFLTTARTVWTSVQSVISSAVAIVTVLWQKFGATLTSFVSTAFTNTLAVIRAAFTVIQGIFNVIAGVLTGDWKRVWDGIKQIVSGAVGVVKGVVKQLWNAIQTLFRAGVTIIKSVFSGAWTALKAAAVNGVSALITKVKEIPGKIKSAVGDLGSILKNAGKAVIQGLIDGIGAMIGALKKKLKGITDLIPGNKGPISKDRVLLKPAGIAIMNGLIDAIDSRRTALVQTLRGVTRTVEGVSLSPLALASIDTPMLTAGARANRGGNTYQVTVQVTDTMSKAEKGREFADAIREAEALGLVR